MIQNFIINIFLIVKLMKYSKNISLKNIYQPIQSKQQSYKNIISNHASKQKQNQIQKYIKIQKYNIPFTKQSITSQIFTKQSQYLSITNSNQSIISPMLKHKDMNNNKSATKIQIANRIINVQQPRRPKILSKNPKCLNPQINFSQQFKLGKPLGKGRFGNVSIGKHIQTGSIFAIKDIDISKMNPKLSQRLLSEIKIQSFLEHKNCLQLYKCYKEQKHLYLILELGETSLFDVLRKKKYFREHEAAFYIRQVINGLIYMHQNGVIHRDLKPQNIILINNMPKIADFGWSTYTPKQKRITFCGTLDYVSPEIVKGEYYDQMVDVWSVGVLCYQLCTGHAPFQSTKSRQDTYKKIVRVDLRFPKHLSSQVQDFISKLLVRDPNERMTLQQCLQHSWMKNYEKKQ